jgi:hypothetical protein
MILTQAAMMPRMSHSLMALTLRALGVHDVRS